MKHPSIIVAAILCLITVGCMETMAKSKTNGFFTLHLHSIEQSETEYSARVKLDMIGKVRVVLKEDNGRSTASMFPDQKTNTIDCELLFKAEMSEKNGKPQIQSLAQIRNGKGLKVGGPSTYSPNPNPKDKKSITDFLEITIQPGQYPIGKELQIGTSHGQPVMLLVEQR